MERKPCGLSAFTLAESPVTFAYFKPAGLTRAGPMLGPPRRYVLPASPTKLPRVDGRDKASTLRLPISRLHYPRNPTQFQGFVLDTPPAEAVQEGHSMEAGIGC
jgi:hypothetical protein